MSYEHLIEEQIQLERQAISQGVKRLHDNIHKLEEQKFASASIYGHASIATLLPLVTDRIEATVLKATRHAKNGAYFKEINQYLKDIEPLALAGIACKLTFDHVFSFDKNESNQLQSICHGIGLAVHNECQMRYYESEAPGLLRHIKKQYWHAACGGQQKLTVVQTMMNRCEVKPWKRWKKSVMIRLGNWLLDNVLSCSGWFEILTVTEKRKSKTYVIPSAYFSDIKDQLVEEAGTFAPIKWPMLVPPVDWTEESRGGYILNELSDMNPMIRSYHSKNISKHSPEVLDFLNKIQKVAWKVNPFVAEVAEYLMERGIQVGKFTPIIDYPMPPKPVDIEDNKDSRQNYRRLAAEAMNKNARSFKNSCRTRMTMETIDKFKDVPQFFTPWSYDYRGRVYPISTYLTPQDTDFGKSCLLFAEGSLMTPEAEEWLAFQVSTSYGLDKSPMNERLEWAKQNFTLITNIATDPISNRPDWEVADEPFLFLAACDEYYHCVIAKDRDVTHLPVFTDATCSGLQILAGLAKDLSTARMVNVFPSDKPQDAYAVVAEAAKPDSPESVRPFLNRKIVKKVVMCIPYNSKPYSQKAYIKESLKEAGWEGEYKDILKTQKAVESAMKDLFPGPMGVMRWIESEVGKSIKRGNRQLTWTTPSGFTVIQKLNKKELQKIELQLLGRVQKQTIMTGITDEVDSRHHRNATAPNLIHSLDADLIRLATLQFDDPIGLIHDSVLCRATDMSDLSNILRNVYFNLFSNYDCLNNFGKSIGAETDPPIIGDLNPEKVVESTYFFC